LASADAASATTVGRAPDGLEERSGVIAQLGTQSLRLHLPGGGYLRVHCADGAYLCRGSDGVVADLSAFTVADEVVVVGRDAGLGSFSAREVHGQLRATEVAVDAVGETEIVTSIGSLEIATGRRARISAALQALAPARLRSVRLLTWRDARDGTLVAIDILDSPGP